MRCRWYCIDSDIQIKEQVGSFGSAIPTKWQTPHLILDKSPLDLLMSLRHDADSQGKCNSYWCMLMHLYVTTPQFSLSWGTEWFFILLWITRRYFYWGCFKVKEFVNMTQELIPQRQEKNKTPQHISRRSFYQYHNKHSGLSHSGMAFFLRKAMFTPQHVITIDEGYRNLTGAVQSSTPFCFSTVFNTTSTENKFFIFSVTLKQWVMTSRYPMPQPSKEGEAAYTFLFIIFIMNIGPGT